MLNISETMTLKQIKLLGHLVSLLFIYFFANFETEVNAQISNVTTKQFF
jgi:hypothetical protein